MLKSLDLLADKLAGSDKILQRSVVASNNTAVIGSGATVVGNSSLPIRPYHYNNHYLYHHKKDILSTTATTTLGTVPTTIHGLKPYTKMTTLQQSSSLSATATPVTTVTNVEVSPIIENMVIDAATVTTGPSDISSTNNNNNNNNNNNSNINSSDHISLATTAAENSLTNENNNTNLTTTTTIISTTTTSSNNDGRSQIDYNNKDDEYSKEQPDPDTIKMFAGQIPKSLDEGQLKRLFEEYGRVHTINVLRDKITGVSRGCCFVTYYTRKAALRAQDALHNLKTLEGMHHPIQMKPADSENRNERKLFVGMLNKKYNESDVRQLFSGHGVIEECTVLRDQNGQSKGCAFVTFASKQAAAGAIKALDRSRTMEGCSAPLVVKFADTQKEKEQKKLQQMQANLWGISTVSTGTTNGLTSVTQAAATAPPTAIAPSPLTAPTAAAIAAASPQILATAANPPQQASPYLAADAISPASLQLFQQLQSVSLPQAFIQGLNTQPDHSAAMAAAGLLTPMSMHNLMAIASVNHPTAHMIQTTPQPQPIAAQLTNATPTLWSCTETLSPAAAYTTTATIPQLTNGAALAAAAASPMIAAQTAHVFTATAVNVAGKQVEGPEGSNLFIYHLPPEFTDTDLASTFLPFGKVISAKIFIDKNTQKTKGFGFVSYDNPGSAYAAIKAMHGFPIGTRRLKVQLKRSKDAAKPY